MARTFKSATNVSFICSDAIESIWLGSAPLWRSQPPAARSLDYSSARRRVSILIAFPQHLCLHT